MLFPSVTGSSSVPKIRFDQGPQFLLIILSLLFVLLSLLPSVLQNLDVSKPYRGIRILPTNGDIFHAAEVHEVVDGYADIGAPYLGIGKNEPSLRPVFPQQVIGYIARYVGVNPLSVLLFAQSLIVFLLTIALGLFAFSITNRPWISVIAAATTLFGSIFFSAPWKIFQLFSTTYSEFAFVRFTIDLEMQWSFLFLLILLTSFSEWMQTNKRKWLFVAAFSLFILILSSQIVAIFSVITITILTWVILFHRDLKRLADLAGFWMLVLLFSTPTLIHAYALSQHPLYPESIARVGLLTSHGPLLTGMWLAISIVIGLQSRYVWPRSWPLVPIIALASFLALNQQIFTGNLYLAHRYFSFIIEPLSQLFVVLFFLFFANKLVHTRTLQRLFIGAFLCLLLCIATMQQWRAYNQQSLLWGRIQQAAPAIKYIAAHLRPGQTVYAQDSDILSIIPAYTSADVTFSDSAGAGIVSRDRLRSGFFFHQWLTGMHPHEALGIFQSTKRSELSRALYGLYYRELSGSFEAIPDSIVEKEAILYNTFVRLSLKEKLQQVPVSAIIRTPHDDENSVWMMFLRCGKTVSTGGGYDVLIVRPVTDPTSCLR